MSIEHPIPQFLCALPQGRGDRHFMTSSLIVAMRAWDQDTSEDGAGKKRGLGRRDGGADDRAEAVTRFSGRNTTAEEEL
jgi:hypothetical protein